MRQTIVIFLVAISILSCNQKQSADLIVHNGLVYTVDNAFSKAQAFAVKDGKIIAIGSSDSILKTYTASETIDAHSKPVYPGFIDAHAHFVGYGKGLFEVNLFGCKDWDEVIQRVKNFEKEHPNEQWIIGRGWDQNKWPNKNFPDNSILTSLFPDKLVLLQRVDGHASIANAKVLDLAGIKPEQKIDGGQIETVSGHLTGMLVDNAVDLVSKIIPKPSKADYEKWLLAAQKNCFAQGLTTITDCGLMYTDVTAIDSLQREGKLKMRLYVMLSDDTANFNRYLARGPYKTDRLYVKGIKAYADGALGSRGACLLEPYNDKPGWNGFLLSPQSHFDSLAKMLISTQFQLCTHAIGDSGNRMVLNIYNKYLRGKNDKRWRIEHAQLVNKNDFGLFGYTSVIPSVQPTHATSDMLWAKDRVGEERLKGGYAYQQLLQENGWLPLGTDFPVEDISPVKTFYAAVVRKNDDGYPISGFQPENALSPEQTLRGMTIWAAKANCMEQEVGSIEVGKKADFIIMDKDLLKINNSEILGTKVLNTWVGGKKVY